MVLILFGNAKTGLTTLSPLQHMSTTSSRATRIPSTWSTRWSSPPGTGIGQTSQNSAARHHGLRVLREEPPEELLEPRRGVIVP